MILDEAPPGKRRSVTPQEDEGTVVVDTRTRNTNATPPAIFFADISTDSAHLTANAYHNGKTDDFVHFCGPHCRKGIACHNVGPPGSSKSLAMHGVCDFCHNSKRTDISVTRTCQSTLHVVRVGNIANFLWYGVLDPSKPLPSTGKTAQDATNEIDSRFRNGKVRQERTEELRGLRGSIATVGGGIKETNEIQRQAEKSGTAEVGSSINACANLMKLYNFKDDLKNKEVQVQNAAKRHKR